MQEDIRLRSSELAEELYKRKSEYIVKIGQMSNFHKDEDWVNKLFDNYPVSGTYTDFKFAIAVNEMLDFAIQAKSSDISVAMLAKLNTIFEGAQSPSAGIYKFVKGDSCAFKDNLKSNILRILKDYTDEIHIKVYELIVTHMPFYNGNIAIAYVVGIIASIKYTDKLFDLSDYTT